MGKRRSKTKRPQQFSSAVYQKLIISKIYNFLKFYKLVDRWDSGSTPKDYDNVYIAFSADIDHIVKKWF